MLAGSGAVKERGVKKALHAAEAKNSWSVQQPRTMHSAQTHNAMRRHWMLGKAPVLASQALPHILITVAAPQHHQTHVHLLCAGIAEGTPVAPMADSQAWPQPATQEDVWDDEGHACMETGGDDGYEGPAGSQDDGSDADNGYQAGVQQLLAAALVTPSSIYLKRVELSRVWRRVIFVPLRKGDTGARTCACTGILSWKVRMFLSGSHSAADFGEQEEDVDIVAVQDAPFTHPPDEAGMVRPCKQQHLHSTTCRTMLVWQCLSGRQLREGQNLWGASAG